MSTQPIAILPQHLRLEASTNCQLKCPSCPTASGTVQQTLGGGFLSFDNFRKIVQENSHIRRVELSNWGEIFLNPDILNIMKYAHEYDIALTAQNGANLNTVKEDVLEAIAKYRFRAITCSIDGASQETYSIYRKNGNFEAVIENIKKIVAHKKRYKTQFPLLAWQFVVFGHNEHEIEKAQALSESLGMDYFFPKISWDENFSPIRDKKAVEKAAGTDVFQQDDYWMKEICSQLWNIPQVNWDGRVLGCCVNTWGDYGNAFDNELEAIVNGEKMAYAREMLLGQKAEREDIPCTTCWHYKSIKENKQWLKSADINHFTESLANYLNNMLSDDLSKPMTPTEGIDLALGSIAN